MRYLSVPDFHFSPKWGEVSVKIAKAVAKAAKDNHVDLIVLPGDLYDAPIMVTDKGGINQLRRIMKMWLSICPVVAIEGTPSHDGPGCYGPLEDMGLVLLKPNKVYGLRKGKVRVVDNSDDCDLLLFGVPELDKMSIQARLSLPADKANGKALELFEQYVTEFIAPMRAMFPNIPALGLLHGNVSDAHKENTSDIILRSSDIVIHTETLELAGLDRWELGHIHTPWESEVINAGYAGYPGIDHNPWGKRDFVPAMNLGDMTTIQRIPYGTPMRKKIYKPLAEYDPSIAYWLVSKDPAYQFPEGMHPWSRITFDEERKETRRVTSEQAEHVRTLSDLFRLIDPDVSQDAIELIDTIPESRAHSGNPVDLRMTSLEVKGCTFFHGRDVKLDLTKHADRVTEIRGDNGSGKSSLLSFCTPYPLVVGKDTSSGRISAIKDFFNAKESLIRKSFIVNGSKHEHLITLKGAHTQSAKVECYLTIDGVPQLDKGSFDEMMETCERLYGPFSDYRLTTFYEQPLQSPKSTSSLMSASMTDIRNLVQNIAGIDREAEKRYALDRLSECEGQASKLLAWVEGAQDMLGNEDVLLDQKERAIAQRPAIVEMMAQLEADGKQIKAELDELQKMKAESDAESKRKAEDDQKLLRMQSRIEELKHSIAKLEQAKKQLTSIKAKLDANEKAIAEARAIEAEEHNAKQLVWAWEAKAQEIVKAERAYQMECDAIRQANERASQDFMTQQTRILRRIDINESEVEAAKRKKEAYTNPCPKCGYIDPDSQKMIDAQNTRIASCEADIAKAQEELKDLVQPQDKPIPEMPDAISKMKAELGEKPVFAAKQKPATLSTFEVNMLHQEMKEAEEADILIMQAESELKAKADEWDELMCKTYHIDHTLAEKLADKDYQLSDLRRQWNAENAKLAAVEEQVKNIGRRLEEIAKQKGDIEKSRIEVEQLTKKAAIWKYISSMLMPSKIPALELELLLDSIDAEATRIIEPYHDGRFAIRTETQSEGKVGSVDRFDILVYDGETAEERSFMKFSPGQKAFFSDAYVKALVRQRNERACRSYTPVIMDESDGPIQPELVGQYYEMQSRYWVDVPVLVVSHSPASHEHIEHMIDIEEIKV